MKAVKYLLPLAIGFLSGPAFGEMGNKPGLFWLPAGMDIDSNNNIYVADQYNRRINVYKFLGSGDESPAH